MSLYLNRLAPATLLGFTLLLSGCGDSASTPISQFNAPAAPAALKSEAPAERGVDTSVVAGDLARVDAPSGDVTMERCMAQRRYLVFHTNEALDPVNDSNGVNDVYLRDLLTGKVTLVSRNAAGQAGNGPSSNATISADGKRIAYQSLASDLVTGDGNGKSDVFLYTRVGQVTTRVSLTAANTEANDDSSFPALSSNGSFLAFVSKADLTGVGTAGIQNLYLRKVDGSSTKLFSAGSGTGANAPVYTPVITNDSRYVAYVSAASNLVAGDSNGTSDVFLYDRATGLTHRVSVDSAGGQADGSSSMPSISDDGNVIAFESKATNLVAGDSNGLRDLFVRNRSAGTTTRLSVDATGAQSNGISYHATLTRDGSRVAFASQASNLVAGDTNNVADVFQRLVADPTSIARASRNIVGDVQGDGPSDLPSYDSDDNDLAFRSSSTNLDWANVVSNNEIFLANRASQTAHVVGRSEAAQADKVSDGIGGAAASTGDSVGGYTSMSAEGRYVVFLSRSTNLVSGDTNGKADVFVRDRKTGSIVRASVDSVGQQSSEDSYAPVISANGRWVAFTCGSDLAPSGGSVYVRDLLTGQTESVCVGLSGSPVLGGGESPAISSDGRYVAFVSYAPNLVATPVPPIPIFNRQVFVRDRLAATTRLVSVASDGQPADYHSSNPSISGDGSLVAFQSSADNLVPGLMNHESNIFLHDTRSGTTSMVNETPAGYSPFPRISRNGRFVTYSSIVKSTTQYYVYDTVSKTVSLVSDGPKNATVYSEGGWISDDGRFITYLIGTVSPGKVVLSLIFSDRAHGSHHQVGVPLQWLFGPDPFNYQNACISGDGRFVTLNVDATDLVPGDSNSFYDVFIRRLLIP